MTCEIRRFGGGEEGEGEGCDLRGGGLEVFVELVGGEGEEVGGGGVEVEGGEEVGDAFVGEVRGSEEFEGGEVRGSGGNWEEEVEGSEVSEFEEGGGFGGRVGGSKLAD